MSSNNVVNLINKTDCSGCGACVCACPTECLSMKSDNEGFLYPHMDDKNCINCGKCLSVCPIKSKPKTTDYTGRVFIVQHKNDRIRRESTSGGALRLLRNILSKTVELYSVQEWTKIFVSAIWRLILLNNLHYSEIPNILKVIWETLL